MSEFVKKLQAKSTPNINNMKNYTTVAKVTATDQINNLCSVQYIDKEGYKSNKDNVPVRVYLPGVAVWFPKEGDLVNLYIEGNSFTVISMYDVGTGAETRKKTEMKKDVYSSSMGGPTGGNLM